MPRARRHCPGANSTCTNLIPSTQRYCPEHQPEPWQGRTTGQGSTRASRKARLKCLRDAGYQCQLRYEGCTGHATHADHVENIASTGQARRDAVDPADLQAACEWCHGIKTQQEARAGRRRSRSNKRPPRAPPRTPMTTGGLKGSRFKRDPPMTTGAGNPGGPAPDAASALQLSVDARRNAGSALRISRRYRLIQAELCPADRRDHGIAE